MGLPSSDQLRCLLESAGFAEPRVIERTLPVIFEGGPRQLESTLVTGGIASAIDGLGPADRERLAQAIAELARPLIRDGALHSTLASHIAIATR